MPQQPAEETLRRLMVVKHLLASNLGQLSPHSDATAVARMILAAHDAADLALAAIASHLDVPDLRESVYLMDYPAKIAAKAAIPFPGTDFLRRLNNARIAFKHYGNLPEPRSWHRVVENTWGWIDDWCQAYLGTPLDSIELEELLSDEDVRKHYRLAKEAHKQYRYREALEHLGLAMFEVMRIVPGVGWPTVGSRAGSKKNTEAALMISAFGVKPSDFLGLQDFLPRVSWDFSVGPAQTKLEWDRRGRGHEGNWTEANVRFCLETFLDLALKVQHAPQVPFALQFPSVFQDVITPKGERADLFEYVYDGKTILAQRVVGRRVIRTLAAGEQLPCVLGASHVQENPSEMPTDLSALAEVGREPTVETADVLSVVLRGEPGQPATLLYVDKEAIQILAVPKDDPFIRRMCPHLFGA
jgi:hypothetical protein